MDLKVYEQRLLALRSRLDRETGELWDAMQEELNIPGDLPTDQNSEGLDREVALIANENELTKAVDRALSRLRDGTYGNCAQCGQPISPERLEATPFAVQCRACAEQSASPEHVR
jgi:RNA polymerase-binding protein DksA